MNSKNVKPFNKKIKSRRHTPQYTMHRYFARRPYNVFNSLIEHYTSEEDIVLDVFCGGGTTVFEGLSLNRKMIGIDLNPLSTFITEMQVKQVNIKILKEFFADFMNNIKHKYGFFYDYLEDTIEWIEWAYDVRCEQCGSIITLSEDNKIKNGIYKCPNKKCISNEKDTGVRRINTIPVGSSPLKLKLRNSDGVSWIKSLESSNQVYFFENNYYNYLSDDLVVPNELISTTWDRAYEDKLYDKGVTEFKDLFTERNYVLNVLIFNEILKLKNNAPNKSQQTLIDILFFTFSASLRYTNNMTRIVKNWENGNPTSMDKHAYWLPNQYIETNIFDKLENRMKAVIKGLTYTKEKIKHPIHQVDHFDELKKLGNLLILNQSSSQLPIPDKSVDSIITDPPYGSNVQYGELSAFWNLWSKYYFNRDSIVYLEDEAIMNRKKSTKNFKDENHYEKLLTDIFTECNRVLKDDGYLVFTFNNKNINVWIAMLKAIANSGFILPNNGIAFQDSVKEYKNTSHLQYSKNIHGDLIYSFVKNNYKSEIDNIIDPSIDNIKNSILETINDLYLIKEKYTNTELYTAILENLTQVILSLITHNKYTDDSNLIKIEKFSSNYIDEILNSILEFKDEYWIYKEDKNE